MLLSRLTALATLLSIGAPVAGCTRTTQSAAGEKPPSVKTEAESGSKTAQISLKCTAYPDLEPQMQADLMHAGRGAIKALRAGAADDLWDSLHPQARHPQQRQAFVDALPAMQRRLQASPGEPKIAVAYHIEVSGGVSDLARVNCGKASDPLGITLISNVGNENLAVVSMTSEGSPFSHATTLQLRRRGTAWMLVGVQVGPSSYRGKDAIDFASLADAYINNNKPVEAFLTLAMAQRLATLGSAITSNLQASISQKLSDVEHSNTYKTALGVWQVGEKNFEVTGLSLAATQADVSPVIKYVSPGGLIKEILDAEADQLAGVLRRKHPELAKVFDAVIFEAYTQAPSDPNKRYDAFRTARYFRKQGV